MRNQNTGPRSADEFAEQKNVNASTPASGSGHWSHSPGPWELRSEGATTGFVYSAEGDLVAQVFDNPDTGCEPLDHEPSEYNMRLIAAAPELWDAFLECESWMRCECGHSACKRCKATKRAAAVMAKVNGQNDQAEASGGRER